MLYFPTKLVKLKIVDLHGFYELIYSGTEGIHFGFSTLVFSALHPPSDIVLLIKGNHEYGPAEINIVNYLIIALLCSMVVKENVKLLNQLQKLLHTS